MKIGRRLLTCFVWFVRQFFQYHDLSAFGQFIERFILLLVCSVKMPASLIPWYVGSIAVSASHSVIIGENAVIRLACLTHKIIKCRLDILDREPADNIESVPENGHGIDRIPLFDLFQGG